MSTSLDESVVQPLLQASLKLQSALGERVLIVAELPPEIFDRLDMQLTPEWMREGRAGDPARTTTAGPNIVLRRAAPGRRAPRLLRPEQLTPPSDEQPPSDEEVREAFINLAGAIGGPTIDRHLKVIERGMHELARLRR